MNCCGDVVLCINGLAVVVRVNDDLGLVTLLNPPDPILQLSVSHRQARMDPPPSSVMSRTLQPGSGSSGEVMEPRRTWVEKHSRRFCSGSSAELRHE